jgi:predicted outer membrane protein
MLRRSGIAGWVVLALATGQLTAQDQQRPGQQQGAQSSQQSSSQPRSTLQSGQSSQAGQSSQSQSDKLDSAVAKWLITMNEAEIQLSQIGQQRAQNSQVKDFASKMIQDHRQFVQQLQQIAGPSHSGGGSQSTSGFHSSQSTSGSSQSSSDTSRATTGSSQSNIDSDRSTEGATRDLQSSQSSTQDQSSQPQSSQDQPTSSLSQSSSTQGQSSSQNQDTSQGSSSQRQPSQDQPSSSLSQSPSQGQGSPSQNQPSVGQSATQDPSSTPQSNLSQSEQNQSSRSESQGQTAQDRSSTQTSDRQFSEGGVQTRAYRGDSSFSSHASSGDLHQLLQLHSQIESKVAETLAKGLQEKQGDQFDQTFIGLQLLAHMRMLDTLQVMQQHASGQLRQTIEDARQATQQHLQMAEQLNKTLETSVASERTPPRQ